MMSRSTFSIPRTARLKEVLNDVILAVPKQYRTCAMQASVAQRLLNLAAAGEKDPLRLKKRALFELRENREASPPSAAG